MHTTKLNTSTNSGISSTAATSVAKEQRQSYSLQNLGIVHLFVKEGLSGSITDFSYVLAAGSGNDNGTGGKYESPAGIAYTGPVSVAVASGSIRYVFVERTQS
jgi:hypothetical protein